MKPAKPRKPTTESALLAAILASPDDDLPRLVYADWCDENGQPERAEFIRTEIEMARLTSDAEGEFAFVDQAMFPRLERRAQELWNNHNEKWYPKLVGFRDSCYTRRGFPHEFWLNVKQFRERGEKIFRLAPTLHAVMLEDAQLATVSLARCLTLGRVQRLQPYFRTAEPATTAAVALFQSKHLRGLRDLSLRLGKIGPEGMSAVADCPSLTGLEELDLHAQFAGDQPAIRIIQQERFRTLRAFCADLNQLTDEFATALANAIHLIRLQSLQLSTNQLTATGLARLCTAQHLRGLERLDLSSNPLGPAAAGHLASATFGGNLRRLDLRKCALGKEGTARLFVARFPQLRELVVTENEVSIAGVRALARNDGLSSLTKLVLQKCRLSPIAVAALANLSNLPGLRALHLGRQPFSDAAVRTMLGGPLVKSLDTLSLWETQITDDGAKAIAAAALPNLRALAISSKSLTEAGVTALITSKTLSGLRVLNYGDLRLSDNGRAMMNERFGT